MKTVKMVVLVGLVLAAGRLYAISPIGPAASTLEQGQVELGFDYTQSEIDDLPFDFTVEVFGLEVRETIPMSEDIDAWFVKLGYGLVDRGDIFFRLGSTDTEFGGTGFAWGLGGRATLGETDRLDWGMLGQVTWFSYEDAGTFYDETFGMVYYRGDLSFLVAQVALGPVYKGDGFLVYGGPFLSWFRADGDMTLSDVLGSFTADLEGESDVEVGAYVGLAVDVKPNFSINTEYQLADHYRALVLGLAWRF